MRVQKPPCAIGGTMLLDLQRNDTGPLTACYSDLGVPVMAIQIAYFLAPVFA
jgi:hypothetical protein